MILLPWFVMPLKHSHYVLWQLPELTHPLLSFSPDRNLMNFTVIVIENAPIIDQSSRYNKLENPIYSVGRIVISNNSALCKEQQFFITEEDWHINWNVDQNRWIEWYDWSRVSLDINRGNISQKKVLFYLNSWHTTKKPEHTRMIFIQCIRVQKKRAS